MVYFDSAVDRDSYDKIPVDLLSLGKDWILQMQYIPFYLTVLKLLPLWSKCWGWERDKMHGFPIEER